MEFSLNSLNNFIDLSDFFDNPNKLLNQLSTSGFEVEEWTKKHFNHLVIAEVREKKQHPQADRLSCCQVFSGQAFNGQSNHRIVCGADNFKEGDKVVLALPGAILPGPFEIKTRKIRGEISQGMLVSLSELGLEEEEKGGIFVLPKEAHVGKDFAPYAGLNDIIFDIDITPNRGDSLSHFGLARELSCILNRPLRDTYISNTGEKSLRHPLKDSLKKQKIQDPLNLNPSVRKTQAVFIGKGSSIKKKLGLEVKQQKLCIRYTGRAVYKVKVQPSPLWLKVFLNYLGLKSINNVVDITNYFLIQWGQPLHAFDLDLLKKKIVVDFSKKNEKFKTLDNQEITLSGKELCIRDEREPLALAGVIGGERSGIHHSTKNIFVESACFEPTQVRESSKRFRIETDSSYRFSRGVSAENTLDVLHKAIALIQELAGGEVSEDEYDFWEKPKKIKPIKIQKKDLDRRLGMQISFNQFQEKMKKLGCGVQKEDDEALITPPYFRFDLQIKEDLIEEYARLEGYDKIPEKIPSLSTFPKLDQSEYTVSWKIAQILVHEGFYQAINHSFISQKFSDSFLSGSDEGASSLDLFNQAPVFVQNPLSAEHNMMRVSLAPSLFKNAQKSIRHGSFTGRLFELGRVFANFGNTPLQQEKLVRESKESHYKEDSRLGLIAWGQEDGLYQPSFSGGQGGANCFCIYNLKTALSTLLDLFRVSNYEWDFEQKAPPFIHPKQYMVLKVRGQEMGYVGSLHPLYAEKHKIRMDLALAEVNTQFLQAEDFTVRDFQNLSPFPAVQRDLSFLVPKDFPADTLIKGIKKLIGSVCKTVRIFDIYENEQTRKENARSISFRLTLQSDKKTLTEEDLNQLQDKLTQKITTHYPVKLRSF